LSSAPAQINKKGSDGDFDTIVVEIKICRHRKDGTVWSVHDFQGDEDQDLASKWPVRGTQTINAALNLEALRRSAFTFMLSYLSNTDPDFLSTYRDSDEEKRKEMGAKIAGLLEASLAQSAKRMGQSVVSEVLSMMADQFSGPSGVD